ncbi:MAG: hypothetical protein ACRDRY_18100 [Pseudonocardiaceae bacterium]
MIVAEPAGTFTTACRPMNPACSPDQPASPSSLQIVDSYQRHRSRSAILLTTSWPE